MPDQRSKPLVPLRNIPMYFPKGKKKYYMAWEKRLSTILKK